MKHTNDKILKLITENDKFEIPEHIKNMTLEEIQAEKERLYKKHLEEKENADDQQVKCYTIPDCNRCT